jgi:hypothetical protein
MCNILKVLRLWMIFEMLIDLEMCVIYCIAIIEMTIRYLLLRKACLVIGATLDKPKSTRVSTCSSENSNVFVLLLKAAENSGIPASLFYMDRSIIDLPYGFLLSVKHYTQN